MQDKVKDTRLKRTVTETIIDPGVGLTVVDLILFSQTGGFGLFAMVVSCLSATMIKAISVWQPAFLGRDNRISRIIKDDRTTLHILGYGLFSVVLSAVFTQIWPAALLPAFTSLVFGVACFKIANSITKAMAGKDDTEESFAKAAYSRPDLYLAMGLSGAGLMAGGWSLIALPLVWMGGFVSLRNAFYKKPESKGHPKIWSASACFIFSIIGAFSGNWHAAIANFLNIPILIHIETQVTEGGFQRIVSDIKNIFSKK